MTPLSHEPEDDSRGGTGEAMFGRTAGAAVQGVASPGSLDEGE